MGKYYAVNKGRETGVFNSWNDCKEQTNGYSGAKFKSFNTLAEAQSFARSGSSSSGGSSSGGGSYSSGGGGGSYSSSSYSSRSSYRSEPYPTLSMSNVNVAEKGSSYSGGSYSSSKPQRSAVKRAEIYTDGSSRGNGKAGARGGIGVYFGPNDSRNVSAPLEGRQTNQRAELSAAKRAVDVLIEESSKSSKPVYANINTDSQYTIKSLTEWADRWERNGYRSSTGEPVQNSDLIKETRASIQRLNNMERQKGATEDAITLNYVPGHKGVAGNEAADRLANKGAEL